MSTHNIYFWKKLFYNFFKKIIENFLLQKAFYQQLFDLYSIAVKWHESDHLVLADDNGSTLTFLFQVNIFLNFLWKLML